jgi:crotonobetainyl-CoA:carnitine CoA-transferase CaiB-like acyl-CoA transferase
MGFNRAEGEAAGDGKPRALPMQILDQATGYLIAFGAAAALRRQQLEGGSWLVRVSLAQTGHWLRGLGRVAGGFSAGKPELGPYLETSASGFGELTAVRHAALLSRTPAGWARPSRPPGESRGGLAVELNKAAIGHLADARGLSGEHPRPRSGP